MSWANAYRPKRFSDVVGQESEVKVLTSILEKGWKPSAILIEGPFGTGKTTLARLVSRALLCENRPASEPCGQCESCLAMDMDNHQCYTELDAASQGGVDEVRQMKDTISYQTTGKLRILCYDESHMLTQQAQNALLQTLEEGVQGVLFVFCTTESAKMLPTIRSRCVTLSMRVLTAAEITQRLRKVADEEEVVYEDKALRLIGTYSRGHVRDALVLLEQLVRVSPGGAVTEEGTRLYLKLDKYVEVYQLLIEKDRKAAVLQLEQLLCNFAIGELVDVIGQILVDAYKVKIGLNGYAQVDEAYLRQVATMHGSKLLERAEKLLLSNTDVPSINYGIALVMNTVFPEGEDRVQRLGETGISVVRKPGKELLQEGSVL